MKIRKLLILAAVGASPLALAAPAQAQVGFEYLGEVQMFGTNFCPRTTAALNGQILVIQQNTALFTILGTTYGGDGVTTFGLPDQRGRAVYGPGQSPGTSNYALGQVGGFQSTTITTNQMAAHNHTGYLVGVNVPQNTDYPGGAALADFPNNAPPIYNNVSAPNVNMATNSVVTGPTGGNQPISILNPYTVVQQCIKLQGVFPSRN